MRALLASALVAAAAAAQAPDVAAPPGRWGDPCGTPAGSHASRALPVVGDVEEAWRLDLPGASAGPPVHWDGVAWLLCEDGKKRSLLAVDLATGEARAKKTLPEGPLRPPLVWDGLVVVAYGDTQLMGYRLSGGTVAQRWKPDPTPLPAREPVLADGEIYFIAGGNLYELSVGKDKSRVLDETLLPGTVDFRGRPAVCGDLVFALHHGDRDETTLHLAVLDRRSGWNVTTRVADYTEFPGRDAPGTITVTPHEICIRAPAPLASSGGPASYAMLPCRFGGGRIAFTGPVGLSDVLVPPSVHATGTLALGGGAEVQWNLWRRDEQGRAAGLVLAEAKDRPDLFRHRVPATVLGDIAYFGSWAADLETGEILWYLPVAEPRFAAVPADRLVLVVDGTALRAFREARDP